MGKSDALVVAAGRAALAGGRLLKHGAGGLAEVAPEHFISGAPGDMAVTTPRQRATPKGVCSLVVAGAAAWPVMRRGQLNRAPQSCD